MSHFLLLAVGNDYDNELQFFYEGQEDPSICTFKSMQKDLLDDFETGTMRAILMPDGTH